MTLLARLQSGIRPCDRRTSCECLIEAVFPSFAQHQTSAIDRQATSDDALENRFEILSLEVAAPRGDPRLVCLAAEAQRLAHAYLLDPLLATGTELAYLLPHSSRPYLRFPRRARRQRGSRE